MLTTQLLPRSEKLYMHFLVTEQLLLISASKGSAILGVQECARTGVKASSVDVCSIG